jgi:hypothetical protein
VKYPKWLAGVVFLSILSHATAVYPETGKKPVDNLENYLEYLTDDAMDFKCTEVSGKVRCVQTGFAATETDENNATVKTRFDRLELLFDHAVLSFFTSESFERAMAECKAAEKAGRGGKAPQKPVPTPLKDTMDRALWRTLDKMVLENFRVDVSSPEAHTSVGEVVYENGMKTDDGNISFDDRIFGTMSLRYRDFRAESNDTKDSAYLTLTHRLEEWLETDDSARADYVGERLQRLYAEKMGSPGSGGITLTTSYQGDDVLSIRLEASGESAYGDRSHLSLTGKLHRLSAIFPPKSGNKKSLSGTKPGMPDFLFLSLDLNSTMNNREYRRLLEKDKTFRRYIMQYDKLIGERYDTEVKRYGKNPTVAGWFEEAKEAFSKIVRGEARRFGLSVRNKTGATAMQLAGMVIGQLAIMGDKMTEEEREKIILDTAAQHLDIRIEAK